MGAERGLQSASTQKATATTSGMKVASG